MGGLPHSGAMQSLERSLRALGHPLSLASVAFLVANDHLLKRAYPSVLTGKLSDFAGLFFFPFLLTALFGLAGLALVRRPFAAGERRRADAWTHRVPGYGAYLLALIPSNRLRAAARLRQIPRPARQRPGRAARWLAILAAAVITTGCMGRLPKPSPTPDQPLS